MRGLIISILFSLTSVICLGQNRVDSTLTKSEDVCIYVTGKSKVILNGEEIGLRSLEKFLEDTKKQKAKIGTVKPTPMKVFAIFEKVVELCEKLEIETTWFRDPEFTILFFENE